MKLLIVSNMRHFEWQGQVLGWGPTVQEIDHLAQEFEEVVHIACLHPGEPPASMLPYRTCRVRLVPVPPAGGDDLASKLAIFRLFPLYYRTIRQHLPAADVVHVRAPANISLLAILMLAFSQKPKRRWAKYAGNWRPEGREPLSYRLQRWLLNRGLHRGVTTVNGEWSQQPAHVHSFNNPCVTEAECRAAQEIVMSKRLSEPLRLILVGRLEAAKGTGRALEVLLKLREQNCAAHLDLVGDGPQRQQFEGWASEQGLTEQVTFHGWMSREQLPEVYAQAHFSLLPSSSEGWPKVLSEAMAYGVVPIASAVGSIPQYLSRFSVGKASPPGDVEALAESVLGYVRAPQTWKEESLRAMEHSTTFTYENYLRRVREVLSLPRARAGERPAW